MTAEQMIVFTIIAAAIGLFIWDKWRYDLVALLALFSAVALGVVPPDKAFSGLADPAVTTVGAILIISAAISRSGFIDWVLRFLSRFTDKPKSQLIVLVSLVTLLSAFMNNVGALAVFLPIAIAAAKKARRPQSELLMPLAFGSLLGGLTTLIGTPPNILIAGFRQKTLGAPFEMFDFAPVGAGIALAGVIYLAFADRFLPKGRKGKPSAEEVFEISDYVSEVAVPEKSPLIGKTLAAAEKKTEDELKIVGLIRDGQRRNTPSRRMMIRAGDTLIVESTPGTLKKFVDYGGLDLARSQHLEESPKSSDKIGVTEAIITRESELVGSTPRELYLRSRYGVHLLAVHRAGRPVRAPMADVRLQESDVVVLQGNLDAMPETLATLECLPLAQRNLQLGRGRKFFMPIVIMTFCVLLTTFGVFPPAISFLAGVLVIGFFRILRLHEMYEALDGGIIILLAAMIPVTRALETTGGAALVSDFILGSVQGWSGPAILTLMLVTTMLVTPFLNNAAAVLLMAPVAASMAFKLGLNVDPFLMAVAIGASCDFLTPIGHQSNTLVMGPGGYKFGDYWKVGLPLSIIVIVVGTPLILWFWPL